MKIKVEQLIIQEEKILNYLLVWKEKNDKSKYLEQLGFNRDNFKELIEEIKIIATSNDMVLSRENEFGNLYQIEGLLKESLIVTIWIEQLDNNQYRFITLYPSN